MSNFTITYTLTFEEMYEAHRKGLNKAYFNLNAFLIIIVGITVCLPIWFKPLDAYGHIYYLLSFIVALIFYFSLYFIRRFANKEIVKKYALFHSIYSAEQTMDISVEGIVFHHYNRERYAEWTNFANAVEFSSVIYLEEKDGFLHYISKSAFTQEQLEAFRIWKLS